ncbi:MAG: hypothetical protein GF353_23390 [Candidatus Lokiarchaeota archaeon]|nr:hypothetical protein [Candidatus Lokiarchaeota archaeon]
MCSSLKDVLIIADGSSEIGMGHLTRELDIGKELQKRGFEVIFLSKNYQEGIKIIEKERIKIYKIDKTIKNITEAIENMKKLFAPNFHWFDFIIVDLPYFFENQSYIDYLKKYCQKIVIISDAPKFFKINADLVFLISSHRDSIFLDDETNTKYFCGLRYFPLRESFQKVGIKTIKPKVSTILLTFGGSDPMNFSKRILNLLKKKRVDAEIILVSGAGYPLGKYKELIIIADDKISLLRDHKRMIDLYQKADICLCSAGNTLIEVLTCGVPAIVLPQTQTEDQRAQKFKKKEMIYNMGLEFNDEELYQKISKLISKERIRKKFSSKAQTYLDGKGVKRIVEKLVKN